MKTTIEMHGYEIVISETEEGLLTVQAMKDGEVVEEFELEGGEDHPGMESGDEDEMMPFGGEEEGDLGEEEEMGEEEMEMGEEEEEMGEEEMEMGEEEEEMGEEEEEEGKLESFNSFVRRKNRR
jgi:hypothetical protein